MKKLLTLFFALTITSVFAKQNISIIWPFSVASNQVNFVRSIIDESNKQQSKYNFVIEFKSGAGGTVAAQYVANSQQLTLLTSSSSFFVRPVYYPNESHKVEDFRPIYIECTGQPLAILSSKYRTLDELNKQKRLTIGIGAGSITEAAARELKKSLPNTELSFIPYSGTLPAVQNVLGGTLDLAVGWVADTKQWVDIGKLFVIGTSGTRDFNNYISFQTQKVKGFEELVGNYLIMANAGIPDNVAKELHTILRNGALASTSLKTYLDADICASVDYDWDQTQNIYKNWQQYWPEKLKK